MERYTLEEIAHTSEGVMVRRRFDERNLAWAFAVGWVFAFASLITVMLSLHAKAAGAPHRALAVVDALLTLFVLGAIADIRASERLGRAMRAWARPLARNPTPWIVAMFLLKVATFIYLALPGSGVFAWAFAFPFTMIGLRLLLGPRLFLHGSILAIVITGALLTTTKMTKRPSSRGVYILIAGVHLFVFGVGTLASRNLKKATIAEWAERRRDARERLRIRDELRFAREVQVSMLPDAPPALDWADVAGVSIPATEVGGDYYDYLEVDGRLAVVCGDVAGHGLASGITLSALRSGFILLRGALLDPASVLARLQEVVVLSSRKRMMVTVSVLLLDPGARRATIASAGHPPLFVRRASTGAVESIDLFAPPLGARLGAEIPQREVAFDRGDVFVLHSDGAYEATNPAGEHFGLDRLAAAAAAASGTAEEIRDAILRSVDEFRAGAAQEDDVTLVVVRIR